jgi:hypothetical protein
MQSYYFLLLEVNLGGPTLCDVLIIFRKNALFSKKGYFSYISAKTHPFWLLESAEAKLKMRPRNSLSENFMEISDDINSILII